MIIFQKVRYVNFMKCGAAGNEIILNRYPSTLISAKNGSGKSAIMDAIVFALFGKPHRDITKLQLVNSINGKNCLVEIWFSIDTNEYLIRRGMRPNVFEIFKNNVLIDQDAATRDYQKFLEQHILKTNVKAFTQSVILGSASFTPFMQMRPNERREIIEDFLDIKIFGVMHSILKEEIFATKAMLSRLDNKLAVSKTQVDGQKNLIKKLTELNVQAESVIRSKILILEDSIKKCKTHILNNDLDISRLKYKQYGMEELMNSIHVLRDEISKNNHHLDTHTKTVDFLNNNQECPACKQDIEDHHKKPVVADITDKCKKLQDKIDKLVFEFDEANERYDAFLELDSKIQDLHDSTRELNKTINLSNKNIQSLENEISDMSSSDILTEKIKLKELANSVVKDIDEKTKLSDTRCLQDQAYDILKDSGVKTTIIKEYLPVINRMINQYLAIGGLFIDFNLDESFTEVIRSRYRDEFSYTSFSEGEKKRIDVAILFAWRQIAKMKNSVNCNILFLDEILDGALDEDGIDSVFQIIEEESKQSNVFIISHNEHFKDKFSNVINILKVGDFSVVQ